MCYDDGAQPPDPPGAANGARGADLVLTASDGNRFAAYQAIPASTSRAQVIIYPDIRGLHTFYKELALRFADVGIAALALDYFGRTAGLTVRDESFEFMPHVQQLQLDSFTRDVEAALDHIRANAPDASIFVVGFCMGGALTLLTGTNAKLGFAGLIPFYAGLSRNIGGRGSVLERAQDVVYPVLGLFGGADQGIPQRDVQRLDELLDTAGVEHQLIIYPDAPHSFFDRRAADYAEASTDAWQQVLRFIANHATAHVH